MMASFPEYLKTYMTHYDVMGEGMIDFLTVIKVYEKWKEAFLDQLLGEYRRSLELALPAQVEVLEEKIDLLKWIKKKM